MSNNAARIEHERHQRLMASAATMDYNANLAEIWHACDCMRFDIDA